MKKLLIMAFAVLAVSAFAVEENTANAGENQNIEVSNILENRDITNVQVQQEVSLGDSFMAAFGMSEGNAGGQQEGSNTSGSGSSSSATVSVGAVSAATNAAIVNANNSTTIITPYGKY